MRRAPLLVGFALALAGLGLADDRPPSEESVRGALGLLRQGELVLTPPDGSDATALALVGAPLETVWETILDYPAYGRFVPRVVRAEVVARADDRRDVRFEVEVPGRNPRYTVRFVLDRAQRTIDGRWTGGDMDGGRWSWRLHEVEGGTVVAYTAHAEAGAASRLLRGLDDRYGSLSRSLDVSSALLMVKAVKDEAARRADSRRAPRRF